MSMFCNDMILLYVHVCVTKTGWKTRPRPKTVILSINKSINQSNQSINPFLSVSFVSDTETENTRNQSNMIV